MKFFFIKDRIDDGEMIVVNCPTEGMWADILTKPLQRKAFRVMRSKLMNCEEDYFENEETEKERAKGSQWSGEYPDLAPPDHWLLFCMFLLWFFILKIIFFAIH